MDNLSPRHSRSSGGTFSSLRSWARVADKELILAGTRIALVTASFAGACLAAEQGQIIAPRVFFASLGWMMFIELVPALIVVDEKLEFIGWHQAVQRSVRLLCTYIFVPLRVAMWLSPVLAAVCSPALLLIAVPLVIWGEWLLSELSE
ncbi:MAG: hypothetical protein ACI9KE_001006 [Polyangiales bacterium]|jgi:hypothetical protein